MNSARAWPAVGDGTHVAVGPGVRIAALTQTPTADAAGRPPPTREVAPQRTPVSPTEIRAALARAHVRLTGRAAPASLLDALSAQVSHETARGGQMFNFNFGGIKGTGPTGGTAACMTREVVASGEVRIRQNFRAYDSLDQGAADYLSVMRGRFGAALAHAQRGDLDGFAHALKQARYYTASEADYAAALRAHAGRTSAAHGPPSLAASDADSYTTALQLARVIEAITISSARIAAPPPDEGG